MRNTLDILRRGIDEGLHPGAQIHVWHAGRVVLDEAVGEARGGVPMRTDSLSLWMSAGKPLTAVLVLQGVASGRLSLDTRVADVLPAFGVNGKQDITVEQLLLHTAGFRGPLNNFTPGDLDQIVSRCFELRLEPGWTPGERAGYHIGSSWFVLGAIAQVVAGVTLSSLVRQDVAEPLGVELYLGMTVAEFDRLAPRMPLMHITEKKPVSTDWPGNVPEASVVPRPGANVRGPIAALAALYVSLLRDERLLPREIATLMTSRRRVGIMDQTFKQTLDWGLGVMIDSKQYAGEHAYGFGPHASPETFGHSGNQSSAGFCDPTNDLVVAWTCNGMPGEAAHQKRASQINAAIYDDLGLA
jgi:CubicO group peptidase (beta-lactamase class C family)